MASTAGRAGSAALVLMASLLLGGCAPEEPQPASQSAPAQLSPAPESIEPLAVLGQEEMGDRTTRYFVDTDLVPSGQIADARPSVVVTLPRGFDPQLDHPVVYLLHGTDDSAVTWFEKGGVETASADLEAIVIQPEGGETGWYTDWSVQAGQSRYWRSFHLDQVVPWVDRTFPTLATPESRAIVGTSAGGFGAVSYAEQRPEVFGTVISFSGVLALDDPQTRGLAEDEFARETGDGDDVLGDGQRTTEAQWQDADPSLHAGRLDKTSIAVYRGSGDAYESGIAATAQTFIDRAESLGLEVQSHRFEELFDEDDPMPNDSRCTGGHEWSCWSGSLQHATPWIQEQIGAPR